MTAPGRETDQDPKEVSIDERSRSFVDGGESGQP
jgi:hypothetical protein